MKHCVKFLLIAVTFFALNTQAGVMPVSGSGVYSDSVEGDSGWLMDGFAGEVDYWTLTLGTAKTVSVNIASDIAFGISIYAGAVADEFSVLFDNDADSLDFFNGVLTFIAGTDPFLPGAGNSLTDIVLGAGTYTIAVGGNEGFFSNDTYNYQMQVSAVPAPSSLLLLLAGVAGLLLARARKDQNTLQA